MKSSPFKEVELNVVNVGKTIVHDVIRRAKRALSDAFHRQNKQGEEAYVDGGPLTKKVFSVHYCTSVSYVSIALLYLAK